MGDKEARAWADGSAQDRVIRAVERHEVFLPKATASSWAGSRLLTPHVAALYVRSDFARRGIGSMLLLHGERMVRAAGHPAVTLEASSNAQIFYTRRGYELQAHYSTESEGLAMRKRLSEDPVQFSC
jgi:GNAT superfamily N-acetyltransferase